MVDAEPVRNLARAVESDGVDQVELIIENLSSLEDDHLRAGAGLSALIALRRRGRLATVRALAPRFAELAEAAQAPPYRDRRLATALQFQLGLTYLLAGDLTLAERQLTAAHRTSGPIPDLIADIAGTLALLYALQGESQLAGHWIDQSIEAETDTQPHRPAQFERTCRSAAQLLLAADRLDWADYHRHDRAIDRNAPDECWTFVLYARARAALMIGNQPAAISRLHEHRDEIPPAVLDGGLGRILLNTAEAELWLSREDLDRAGDLVAEFGTHPLELATAARYHLLRKAPAEVEPLVDQARWPLGIHRRDRITLLLLDATSQLQLSATDRRRGLAARRLAAALADEIAPWLFTFALADRDVVARLPRHAPVLGDLLQTLLRLDPPRPFLVHDGRIDLTPRELTVLEHLARQLTVTEIAARLGVSPSTIKSQRKIIFRKLGVATRADAIEIAYRVGLLATDQPPGPTT